MNLLAKIFDVLNKNFGVSYQPIEQTIFLGEVRRTISGTLRDKPDYDDGWLLALAYHVVSVFDVGCNIGQASCIFLSPGKVRDIVLIDANPEALAIAAKNMIMNKLSHKTRFINAFAAESTGGRVSFFTTGAGAAGSIYVTHAKTAANLGSSSTVPTISLDWISEWYQLTPELVKIDTEGAEYKVLQGSIGLAKKRATKFLVEMHSNSELSMKENARNILNWCISHGYTPWYLKEKIVLESPVMIENRGRCHLLLLPSEHEFPKYLRSIDQSADLETVQALMRSDD